MEAASLFRTAERISSRRGAALACRTARNLAKGTSAHSTWSLIRETFSCRLSSQRPSTTPQSRWTTPLHHKHDAAVWTAASSSRACSWSTQCRQYSMDLNAELGLEDSRDRGKRLVQPCRGQAELARRMLAARPTARHAVGPSRLLLTTSCAGTSYASATGQAWCCGRSHSHPQ